MQSLKTIAAFEQLQKKWLPFIIYKHSTQCIVSSNACKRVEEAVSNVKTWDSIIYKLDVIENKLVSNHIAEYTNVTHESPQILLFEKNDWWSYSATEHASHWLISEAYVRWIVNRALWNKNI